MTAPDYVPPGFIYTKSDAWAEYAWQRHTSWAWFKAGLARGVIPFTKPEFKDLANRWAIALYEDTGDPERDTATANMKAVKELSKVMSSSVKGMLTSEGRGKGGTRVHFPKDQLVYAEPDGRVRLPDTPIDGGYEAYEYGELWHDLLGEAHRVLAPAMLDAFLRVAEAGGPLNGNTNRFMHVERPAGVSAHTFAARYRAAVRNLSKTQTWQQIAAELGQR